MATSADSDSDPDAAAAAAATTTTTTTGEKTTEDKEAARNAFTELMAPKPTAPPLFKDRMGLGAYLDNPASLPPSVAIYHNDAFVAIRDKFPKATVHALLLPRSPQHVLRHPLDAFADADFLAAVRADAARLVALVAAELQRRLGPFSRADAARQAVLDGADARLLPPGRDWAAQVRCGVHAVPSMRHLHVHVLSRDMHSPTLRHRKHYNSFATPFFVDLVDLPLADDDARRHPKDMDYLGRDLRCWRCGTNFGRHFKRLKEHLDDEFEAWKKE